MRRRCFWFSIALSVAMLLMPVTVTAESQSQICVAGDYQLEQKGNGQYAIKMLDAGYSTMQSPGDPSLPQKIIDIKVPADLDLSDLTIAIDNVESTVLNGTFEIVPEPPRIGGTSKYWGSDKNIVDGKNMLVYGNSALFPQQCVTLLPSITNKEIDNSSGHRSLTMMKHIRFAFMPFQYNTVARMLNFVSKATVTVRYNNNKVNSAFQKATTSFVAAPLAIADYVIITTNATVANSQSLANFVAMKQFQGRSVRIVTETDFDGLTGQAPNGRAEKIRKWLQDNYQTMSIDYVLLIGNPDPDDPLDGSDAVGDIPMKMCYPGFYNDESRDYPTDFFYADLLGNWDIDNDGIYGVNKSSTNPRSPDPVIAPTTFSARWTGELLCDFTDNYTFSFFSDDGVRLKIDGSTVIDNWTDHLPATTSATVNLTAGRHAIVVEYYQNTGYAIVNLKWENTTNFTWKNLIPESNLFHWDPGTSSYISGGLDATYYDNIDFTGTTVTRVDRYIGFIWSTGDNDPVNGRKTGSQVAIGRIPVYNNDYATLDNILNKTIQYESADPASIAWRKSILLPMKPVSQNNLAYPLGEGIRNDFALADGFTCFRIYEEDYSSLPTPGPTPERWPCNMDAVELNWINNPNSRGMVTWVTHGSANSAVSVFESSRAANLNDARPSFTFQASCLNGYPERSDNLGYALLKQGAIATVSASRTSQSWNQPVNSPTCGSNECIAYAYTKHVIDAGLSAGEAVSTYKAALSIVDENVLAYNLYGDPDCHLLTTYPNQPPTANAGGPYSVNQGWGASINLDGSASSDPEGSALQYRWDWNSDGIWDIPWSSSPYAPFGMCGASTMVATLEVKDVLGLTATATAQVTFLNLNPVADAGVDQTVNEGSNVSFNGSFTDEGCEAHTYSWNFGDLSGTAGMLNPVHAFCENGAYNVTLTVTDAYGGVGTDVVQITVNNVAPTTTIDAVTPTFIMAGQQVTLQGSFTDVGWNDSHTSMWEFGEGTSASGALTEVRVSPVATGTALVNKIYTVPGVYTVRLTITDDDGGAGIATRTVNVLGSLHTTQSLIIADNTKVYSANTFGGTYSEIGSLALLKTSMLFVNGDASVRSQGKIDGSVTVSGLCRKQDNSAIITGPIIQGTPVSIPAIPSQTVPVGMVDKTVNNDQIDTWAPGAYRDGLVKARGKVTLAAGTYNFRTLVFESGAKLMLNTASGPITINADEQLNFGNGVQITYSAVNKVSYYSNYNGNITIGTDNVIKAASIIAPNAIITVNSRTTVNGVICSRQLKVEPNCIVNSGL